MLHREMTGGLWWVLLSWVWDGVVRWVVVGCEQRDDSLTFVILLFINVIVATGHNFAQVDHVVFLHVTCVYLPSSKVSP